MFGLFQSKRNRWKKRLTNGFDVYIPGLKGMDPEEKGFLLDQAAQIKSSSLMLLDKDDPARLFWVDPTMVSEEESLERLDYWYKYMATWSREEGTIGNSKAASLQVFFNSLGGMTIVELRVRGKEMWKELSRGFPYCTVFNPKEDIPFGYEKIIK